MYQWVNVAIDLCNNESIWKCNNLLLFSVCFVRLLRCVCIERTKKLYLIKGNWPKVCYRNIKRNVLEEGFGCMVVLLPLKHSSMMALKVGRLCGTTLRNCFAEGQKKSPFIFMKGLLKKGGGLLSHLV